MIIDPLDFLYSGDRNPGLFAGYSPPGRFPHAEWVLVGESPKRPDDGDGQAVLVFESRWPATFFRIEILSGITSTYAPLQAYTLSFGSGMGDLVGKLVDAITSGMINFHQATKAQEGTQQ